MTGLNHVLTGSAIGLALQDPLLIMPAALVSHFILDSIPHFDHEVYSYGSKHFVKIMVTDGVLSLAAVATIMLLVPHLAFAIALGATFAILPDAFWLYYYKHNRPQTWFFRFHKRIQWFERPPGAMVEASFLIFISTVLFALK